jgi:hypothetical protein
MNVTSSPKHEPGSPDYNLDCQSAMERAFQAVAAQAEAAGWDKGEVAYALLELARFNIKGMIADGEIDPQTQAAA